MIRKLEIWTCVFLLTVISAGCASSPPSSTMAPARRSLSVSANSPKKPTPVAIASSVTPRAVRPTVLTTPTITETPSITPTLGPPTATGTPAPGEATLSAAQNVDQALIAFAQAQSGGDTQATLDAQRRVLDAASAAAPIAEADQTTYGQQLRSALDAVRAAAAGDFDKLSQAHQALVQIEGSEATPVVLPRPANQTPRDLGDVAQSLRQAVDAYSRANDGGNSGDLLRAQRDLLDAVANAQAATKNGHSPMAQQIQTALTAIHDGLAGDTGKFRDAENDLSNVTSQASVAPTPAFSPTPTVVPTASATPTFTPTASPSPNPTTTGQSSQHTDLQPLQNSVDNRLQALQNEAGDQNSANVQQAEDNLRQTIQQASGAIADDHSPAADRFRAALGTAQNVASGDRTKVQAARDQLRAAIGQ